MILLPILCFGQQDPDRLDTDESLFNRVALELGINMREWWTPDATFLSGIRREQLLMVALDVGAVSHIQGLTSRSKQEIVAELARYFSDAASGEPADDPAHRCANEWLPGILKFPASGGLMDPH
jgi:ParB family transcriptional regulator, chromosome partitioning protein